MTIKGTYAHSLRERAWVRHLLTRSHFPFGRFVDILRENGESGDIKECPLCQVLIMREAGCAQMMCGHCKHIFCWHCLKSLDVSQASVFNYNCITNNIQLCKILFWKKNLILPRISLIKACLLTRGWKYVFEILGLCFFFIKYFIKGRDNSGCVGFASSSYFGVGRIPTSSTNHWFHLRFT